jgi:hypothetical protein
VRGVISSSARRRGGATTDLILDWDTGNLSQWTTGVGALEAGSPAHQSTFSQTVRRGTTGWAWRAEVHNNAGDLAANSYRSLCAKYDSQEGLTHGPSDFAYGFSFRVAIEDQVAARFGYSQIWELHHRANLYNVPGLSLAPHAIELINGNVNYRFGGGSANWNGSSWTGWNTYSPTNTLRANYSTDTWYDIVVRIKCSEASDGICQAWCRAANEAFSGTPQFTMNAPTLPYVPGGVDPLVPTKISTSDVGGDGLTGLYLEAGLYTGSSTWYAQETTQQQIIYLDGMRRYSTSAEALAGFPA